MHTISQFMKGIALGAGAILPGISSGVLCVVFGIYETLIDSILGFYKHIKKSCLFLLPLLLGGFVGIVLLGNFLQYLFEYHHTLASFAFIGLIVGSIPGLIKEAHVPRISLTYWLSLLLTLCFSLYLISLEFSGYFASTQTSSASFFELMLAGFVMSFGVVVPGISSTVILMLIGKYTIYLSAVASFNFSVLFPMGIGLVLGGLLLLILIKFLFAHFRSITYFAIIGFALGSIPVLFPSSIASSGELLLGIILMLLCMLLVNILGKIHGQS